MEFLKLNPWGIEVSMRLLSKEIVAHKTSPKLHDKTMKMKNEDVIKFYTKWGRCIGLLSFLTNRYDEALELALQGSLVSKMIDIVLFVYNMLKRAGNSKKVSDILKTFNDNLIQVLQRLQERKPENINLKLGLKHLIRSGVKFPKNDIEIDPEILERAGVLIDASRTTLDEGVCLLNIFNDKADKESDEDEFDDIDFEDVDDEVDNDLKDDIENQDLVLPLRDYVRSSESILLNIEEILSSLVMNSVNEEMNSMYLDLTNWKERLMALNERINAVLPAQKSNGITVDLQLDPRLVTLAKLADTVAPEEPKDQKVKKDVQKRKSPSSSPIKNMYRQLKRNKR